MRVLSPLALEQLWALFVAFLGSEDVLVFAMLVVAVVLLAFGVALFADPGAVTQLWLFWVAPIAGAAVAGFVSRWLQPQER